MDKDSGKDPDGTGVVLETRVISIAGESNSSKASHRSFEAATPEGNVTVHVASKNESSASESKVRVIPPPRKPLSQDDFVVHIKSLERVDGKAPLLAKKSKSAPKVNSTSRANVSIQVFTVTEAPRERNEPTPSRLEYSSPMWADDWGPVLRWASKLRDPAPGQGSVGFPVWFPGSFALLLFVLSMFPFLRLCLRTR